MWLNLHNSFFLEYKLASCIVILIDSMLGDSLEGDAFDPRFDRSPSPPKNKTKLSGVGAILKGTVKNIRPFGAFVLVRSIYVIYIYVYFL